MTRVCAGITRSGGRCTVPVGGAQHFCHLHDPARADERRRNASRAGRSKPASKEIAGIKARLAQLTEDVLTGDLETGRAAVVNQLINTLLRALEAERKLREQEELEGRLEALEQAANMENRKGKQLYG